MAKKPNVGRTEYDVSPEQFIRVWQAANSVDEVAAKLKMPKPIVLARKSNYVKAGVKLKKMPRKSTSRNLDVDRLNALIDELNKKT